MNKHEGKNYGDWEEHGSNDHAPPDRVAGLNQVHPVDNVAANVGDEKPKIWLKIVINFSWALPFSVKLVSGVLNFEIIPIKGKIPIFVIKAHINAGNTGIL